MKTITLILALLLCFSCRKTYTVSCRCYNDEGDQTGFDMHSWEGEDNMTLEGYRTGCAGSDELARKHHGYCVFRESVD